MKNSYHQ